MKLLHILTLGAHLGSIWVKLLHIYTLGTQLGKNIGEVISYLVDGDTTWKK